MNREKLLKCDPGIVEIVQFGPSVYAPDLSRDVDLLVIPRTMTFTWILWMR